MGGTWTEFIGLTIGTRGGPCEHENEASGSIQCREFLE